MTQLIGCDGPHFRIATGVPTKENPHTMGDKSPKATNKQASQKQAKAKGNEQKKSNAAAAKQAPKAKK